MADALELFKFSSAALDKDVFKVVRFKGAEGLSKLFQFDVTVLSDKSNIDLDAIMKKPATFSLTRADQNVEYNGTLKYFDVLHASGAYVFYKATLVPSLWWLTLRQNSQVFLDMGLDEIIEAVLKDGGLSASEYDLQLQRSYPKREYVCQYNETNYDFLCRQMEHYGVYYYFKHADSESKLIITDTKVSHVETPQSAALRYKPPTGLESSTREDAVQTFVGRKSAVPKKVTLKDYNYRKPSADVAGKADVAANGVGEIYLFGEHAKTSSEGDALAKTRAEERSCREQLFFGSGTASFLRSGYLVTLQDHFRSDFNQQYLLIESKHQGSQPAYVTGGLDRELIETERHYSVDFTAIPASVQFRPEQTTEDPKIYGTMNAKIDAAGSGEYAELDDQGRYKVILPFDQSGRSGGKASKPLRMLQPYGGADHGMHFPLHKNTEVLLSFIDGDPDRPVIAGVAPNPDNPSLIKDQNQTQALIQTGGQNKLLFEDSKDQQHMLLRSPTETSYMRLGAHDPKEEESHEESGFRFHTEGKFISEIGTDLSYHVLGNKTELTVGTIEEVTAGAFTEITAGAFSEIVAGQLLDIVLGMIVEVKKGKCVEIGEASRIGISQEQEMLAAEGISLKAGGEAIGVKKAIASAISLVTGLTSASMAAAKTKKPHLAPKLATAGTIAGISGVLWAVITAYLLKAKMPHQFKSTLEMDKHKTEIQTPKFDLKTTQAGVAVESAQGVEVKAQKAAVEVTAQNGVKLVTHTKNIDLIGNESITMTGNDYKGTFGSKFAVGFKSPGGEINFTGKKIDIANAAPGGEVSIATDKFTWSPKAVGQLNFGPLKINTATGQVIIG